MAYLALIRHGESEWNALDLWTGWTDVSLSQKGQRQAREAGEKLKAVNWDLVFESDLKRAKETTDEILKVLNKPEIERIESPEIKERDYGNFTGFNKIEVENRYGYETFEKWHRGWDFPLPHGETLKDVYNRTVPYFELEILPRLNAGKNVIISAHGNSLRALVKYLESIPEDQFHLELLEIPVGKIIFYKYEDNKFTPVNLPTP